MLELLVMKVNETVKKRRINSSKLKLMFIINETDMTFSLFLHNLVDIASLLSVFVAAVAKRSRAIQSNFICFTEFFF